MSKLYFRYGAMGCGKSASLLQVVHNYIEKNMKVVLIKPKIDSKAGNNVESRIGISRTVDYLLPKNTRIKKVVSLEGVRAIIIDEAQFLSATQVDELYEISKEENIPVLCYGLRCDFKMKGFPGSVRLLEIADDIEELKNVCECGNKATQNLRRNNGVPTFDGEQILIDGSKDNITYEGVCGKCYLKYKKEYERR